MASHNNEESLIGCYGGFHTIPRHHHHQELVEVYQEFAFDPSFIGNLFVICMDKAEHLALAEIFLYGYPTSSELFHSLFSVLNVISYDINGKNNLGYSPWKGSRSLHSYQKPTFPSLLRVVGFLEGTVHIYGLGWVIPTFPGQLFSLVAHASHQISGQSGGMKLRILEHHRSQHAIAQSDWGCPITRFCQFTGWRKLWVNLYYLFYIQFLEVA